MAQNFVRRKSSCVNARGIPPATQQVLAMLVGGGYPIQSWWGRVPHPVMVGVIRFSHGGGVPHPVMVVGYPGYPHPNLVRGYPGYPPLSRPGMGYLPPPTIHTWDGVPPTIGPGMGYPPPPPSRPGTGYPPPHKW